MVAGHVRWRRAPSGDVVVTLALFVVGCATAAAYAVAQPAYSTGDEMAHVDYAYQVWHGRLPDFFAGLSIDPGVGFRPGVQWVSQHPPLLYAVLAPVVGPLVDAGHPVAADLAARAVLVVLAGLSVLLVRWAVRAAMPAYPRVATVAALIYGLSSWLPRQGGSVYNDLPAVTAVVVATGFLFRAMRDPGRLGPVVGLAAATAVASQVRFSTLPLIALLALVLGLHRLVVERRVISAVVHPMIVAVSVVAASGWWWLHNRATTGNLQGSRADYWIEERGWEQLTFGQVMRSDFWPRMLQQFFDTSFMKPREAWEPAALLGIGVLFLAPMAVGAVVAAVDAARARTGQSRPAAVLVLLTLLGTIGLVVATQVLYSMSSGSNLPRYFFALVPAGATLMAVALARWRWALGVLLLWVATRLVALGVEVDSTIDRPLSGPQAAIYPHLAWICFATVVVAAGVVLAVELSRARRASAPAIPA